MDIGFKRAGKLLSAVLICIATCSSAFAQTISFNSSTLAGDNLTQPTSLQFGPDGRLYVAQQYGKIFAYTVVRNGTNSYSITSTEEITLIENIPNHNDDGTLNTAVKTRQVTGIVVTGTAANPVIFVTSSDPRIGGGTTNNNDKNLDTNSGMISRLTWNGTAWVKLDLVRGLPRSEENHSCNGLAYDKVNNVLYMAQGSNTNMGAPSNNFAFLPEYAYSTAILKIDLNAIGNSTYDLPTLDDETRTNVSGNDVNDPFGGNDGLNMAKLVAGSPVTIYSPGWRNNYDILITQAGKMYSFDNGPNVGWGGPPTACSIAVSEPGVAHCDGLHCVSGPGYYAGFPNPVRANRNITFNASNPQTPIPLGMENPTECNYIAPGSNGSLTTICSSTDGLCEYTASNFSNTMKGSLIAVAFNGKMYRFKLNATGTALASGGQTVLATGFGASPLDVIAQGDNDIFPGTIWVALYGSNDIVVFEPNDFVSCAGNANSMSLDDDGDGYSNGDETQNGTDKCSPASRPDDFDNDMLSNLLDNDDDNDGIIDNVDKFAQDSTNGTTTTIPFLLAFQNAVEGGIGNWGFTGMMCNNTDDYMTLYDMDQMTVGGAAYKFTVDNVNAGDALGALNTQKYAFQRGINVGSFPFSYIINGRVMGPFAGITPSNYRSMGIYMGTGDQDNYLKIVCAGNGGAGGIEIVKEVNGVATSNMYSAPILGASHVNFYLQVDPVTKMVQPSYSISGGAKTDLGPQIAVPASWISNVLAVGFISTSRGSTVFGATWDYIAVDPVEGTGNWVNVNTTNTCTARHESAFVQCGDRFYIMGGRGIKPVECYNYNTKTWTTLASPPIQLHHFQAVALNGLIYVVCGFTGNFPNETPLANVYIFDPAGNAWHVGMDIPAPRRRGSAGAVAYNNKIYVVSGLTNGHLSGWVPYVDVFDPQKNTWETLPDIPHMRDHFQVALHGDNIYAIGGRNSGWGGNTYAHTIAETDVYNISDQSWTTLSSPEGDIPTQRAACSLAVLGDEILAIGGESMAHNTAHSETEALDVNTNSWRTLDALNTGRHGSQAIVNNFGVYIAAGCGARGGTPELNTMEAFYLYGQTTPTGTTLARPTLTLSQASLAYGDVHLGNSSVKTLFITNPTGNQALLIKSLTMAGGGNFTYSTPYTMPIVLNVGDTLKVDVTFAPTSAGAKTGTFTIAHSGTNGPNTIINLTGNSVGQATSVRINAGGPNYTTAASESFIADTYYSNNAASTTTTTQAIAGTTEDALYQTERYGHAFGYNIPVQNGTYTVKLHFAEIWSGASNPGVRIFDVNIENALVIDDLDLYSVAGMYMAYVRTFTVTVNDGSMNIDFLSSQNNAKINAIEIIAPTTTQGNLTAVPGSMNFPTTDVNVPSLPSTLSLTNTGGSPLTINSVSISGANAADFIHTFTSPVTVAVGATTTFDVTFTPSAPSARSAAITINHTGGNSPLSVALSGMGSSSTGSCGYYVEQNGLLVVEVESAPASEGWTSQTGYANYTGTEYYTWTGPEYLNEKGNGMLSYQFKINNPGKYRFKIRTQNGGPLNTHNNDVWVRFPDHGVQFVKSGVVMDEKSGWWKEWQNNLNVWTYNTWAGESTFWEVYVNFPYPGIYSMDISGRTQLYSLDRFVLYRADMVSDWAATSANPAPSQWENCPATPLVWYRDADLDLYGTPDDSVLSVSKPGVGYVWNKLDCDDDHGTVYPGAPEILDGRDNDCDGIEDEGAYLSALYINCGGSTYPTIAGDVFESDRLYSQPSSGKFFSNIGDILNTDDDGLYKSERVTSSTNTLSYDFQAIPGYYTMTLYFAEQDAVVNPGERVFDVMVEDSVILNDLDIIARVGYKTAFTYSYTVHLTDSVLNLKFVDVVGKAKVNAIKVAMKVNTPPTFGISGNSTYNEDFAGTNTLNITPTTVPADETWQVVTYTLTPPSVPFANVSINPSTGKVSITSVPNMTGQQQFIITANDGYPTNNIATKTFTLKVLAINDAPAFTMSGNVTVDEDFGTQIVTATPAPVPSDEASQVVTYSLSPASVAFANVTFSAATGQVSFASIPYSSGSQVFTVTANDGQVANNTYTQTFTFTVNNVNDAPVFALSGDVTVDEDFNSTQFVTVTPGFVPPNETSQTVTYSLSPTSASFAHVSFNSATGKVTITSIPNGAGTQIFTVTANDGQALNNTHIETFTLTVNPVNDAPAFTLSGNVIVNEDFTTTETVSATPATVPADEASQVVTYSMTPASVSFANVSLNSATGEVTITAIPDENGSQTFTITADDGQSQDSIYSKTFTLTVNAVNDAPVFTLSGDVTVIEDAYTQEIVTVTPGTVPANETSQNVTYTLSPASVAFANVSFNSTTGKVTITPVQGQSGTRVFTVTANDGQSQHNTYAQTFTLTVEEGNYPPSFTINRSTVTVNEDFATTETVLVTPDPVRPNEANQVVTYSLSPTSVGFANISFDSHTGNVTITSVADLSGSQQFTITADDGQNGNNTYSKQFTLTVNSVNDAPVFTLSGDVVVNEDFTSTEIVTVTPAVVPANETGQTVTYSLTPPTVSFANISFNNATGGVTITSIANAHGSQLFTVKANDGQASNNTHQENFLLTVSAENDQPTLDVIANPSNILEDSGVKTLNLTGISAGGSESQTVTISATSDNPLLFSMLTVNYTNPNTTAVLSYQPAPNQWGSATVSVTVNDGQSSNNTITRTFVLTVTSVNDAPKFTMNPASLTIAEDFTGTRTASVVPAVAPTDEAAQTVTYSLSPMTVPFANISFNSTTGTLQITSIANMNGSRTLTITADDGQSQNNFDTQTLVLSVTPDNDAPVFTIDHGVTVFKNFTSTETIHVIPATVPADETYQTVTYSLQPATVNFANVSFNSSTGTATITSITNMTGSQIFTITANDGQSLNNVHDEQFTFAVVDTNYQPTLDAISNPAAINEDAGLQTAHLTGITAGFHETQTVTVTAVSDNPGLITNPVVHYTYPSTTCTLDYTPAANQSGTATITVTIDDGQLTNHTVSRSFIVVVNPVNDIPTLDAIADPVSILEDAAMQTISMAGISDGADEHQTLVVTATSSNPALIPNPTVNYNSPATAGTLQYTPPADQSGSAVITVTVNDGQAVNNIVTRTFTVVVTPVNDAPVVTAFYRNGQEDKSIGFVASNFTDKYSDIENSPMTKIKIVSLPVNGALLMNGNTVSVSDEITVGNIQNLTYNPVDEFSGVDSFMWNGYDGQLYAVNAAKVYLDMNNVNDKPVLVAHIPDITVNEDAPAMQDYVNLGSIFTDAEDGSNMTYTVSANSNPTLVNVSIDVNHQLDVTFVSNENGSAVISIQAKDAAGLAVADTFNITVNSIEDMPSVFNLLTPTNGSVVGSPSAIEFSWQNSVDADGDNVEYAVTIKGHGVDTTMSAVAVNSLLFDGESLFTPDSTYKWNVVATDGDDFQTSSTFRFKVAVTAIGNPNVLENGAMVYPNPFDNQVNISYSLKTDAKVKIKIRSYLAQQIEIITDEKQTAGAHSIQWNASNAAAGLYFFEMELETQNGVRSSFTSKIIKR